MLNEFQGFIAKGNVMDMAVGINSDCQIHGGGFDQPLIGLFFGGVDFSNLFVVLRGESDFMSLAAAREAGLRYLPMGLSSWL